MSSGPGAPTSPSPFVQATLPLAGSAADGSLHVDPFTAGEAQGDADFTTGAALTPATASSEFQHGMTHSVGR